MKPGFYVNTKAPYIYLHYGAGNAIGINVVNGSMDRGAGLESLYTRPATRQDIIDKLLPLIPEKKEPGQVAYETKVQFSEVNPFHWDDLGPKHKDIWATVERAVLEAHK